VRSFALPFPADFAPFLSLFLAAQTKVIAHSVHTLDQFNSALVGFGVFSRFQPIVFSDFGQSFR
jgi:hypothetical protein